MANIYHKAPKGYNIVLEDAKWNIGAIVEAKHGIRERFRIISVRYNSQIYDLRAIKGKQSIFSLSFSNAHSALNLILDIQGDFKEDLDKLLTED